MFVSLKLINEYGYKIKMNKATDRSLHPQSNSNLENEDSYSSNNYWYEDKEKVGLLIKYSADFIYLYSCWFLGF